MISTNLGDIWEISGTNMSEVPKIDNGSPERFGYSWQQFSTITEEQKEQFIRWTCLLDPVTDWRGKRFLDVGCGAGRNSYWAMKCGAAGGRAIDVDEHSLAAARTNLADYNSVEVCYCSAYEIAEKDYFDIVFSIGVIHHLEDPVLAISKMKQAAKPNGKVLIWVYGHENMALYVNLLNPMRKIFFSRLPVSWIRVSTFARVRFVALAFVVCTNINITHRLKNERAFHVEYELIVILFIVLPP